MTDSKGKKINVELTPVQIVWLHSQHLFQQIEEQSGAKFFKNNTGVEIKGQHSEAEALRAQADLFKHIEGNAIRLIQTTLDKLLYIKISKEARREFPNTYIIFLHYQTFQNCSRKLQQKFNITSIAPQFQRHRKVNPNFCFLIADKTKINQIQKFTAKLLLSQLSCASTTFSQKNNNRRELTNQKRTMSVSSLRGSFSQHNEQCRISLQPTEEEMYEVSESSLCKLDQDSINEVVMTGCYEGVSIYVEQYYGTYMAMKKRLYYANRLQLSGSPHLQPIYAYAMVQLTSNRWRLSLITDKCHPTLAHLWQSPWFAANKIELLLCVGRALLELHSRYETYGRLTEDQVLIDDTRSVLLSCVIVKDIPPHVAVDRMQTDPYLYDLRNYLLFVYRCVTDTQLSYEMLVKKESLKQSYCSVGGRAKNSTLHAFLQLANRLFIRQITLSEFVQEGYAFIKNR